MSEKLVKKVGNTSLYVTLGDITQTPTDAIMTAINPGGMWFGGIDGAIMNVAGQFYHGQAAAAMPLEDLQTVVAKGDKSQHKGQFDDVVFVVDALESPLDEVIYNALEAAHKAGYKKLLVPAVRMGVMAGAVEKTPQETVSKIAEGIQRFIGDYNGQTKLENITFVVYNDQKTIEDLGEGLKLIPSN